MTPIFDIAITLSMLALLVAAITLTKRAWIAAASIWFSIREHIRGEPKNVSRTAKRNELFRPSVSGRPAS